MKKPLCRRKPFRSARFARAAGTGLLAALTAGCASYHGRPFFESRSAASFIEHREIEGLYVAAVDLSPPRLSSKYFDRDLVSYGYIPVLLLLELDRSSSGAFNLRREDVRLTLPDGTRLKAADPLEVAEAVSFSHVRSAFGFLLVIPGFVVASSVNRANAQIEEDYARKALESVRVSPNLPSYRGVVFFKIPEELDEPALDGAFLELTVYQEGRDGEGLGRPLDFPVHFVR